MVTTQKIPKKIFIVPYRNRGPQMYFFCKWMNETILKDTDDYEIYFSHQYNKKCFNRGAIKNIGFIVAKKLYPNDYKNITFIFNDIDCVPYKNIFSYNTDIGTIAHYYGFEHSLGGIVVIKGIDFELINGYVNLYSWGQEDRCLQTRCEKNNLIIDRTKFYKIGSKEILQLFDGVNRIINNKELNRAIYDNGHDGINTIHNLFYTVDKNSKNKEDDDFIIPHDKIFVINIFNFLTEYKHYDKDFSNYDLRIPESEIFKTENKTSNFIDNDWTNIPVYSEINNSTIHNDNIKYNNNNKYNNNVKYNNNIYDNSKRHYLAKQKTPTEIYGQNYAVKYGIKPRATTSVKVRMGGVVI